MLCTLLDLGPGAGVHGGNVVFEGTPSQIVNDPKNQSHHIFPKN